MSQSLKSQPQLSNEVDIAYLQTPVTIHGMGIGTQTTLEAARLIGEGISMTVDSLGLTLTNSKNGCRALIPSANVKVLKYK